MLQIPDEAQRIPLNRAGGESWDSGVEMTMRQAIEIAQQYGHVPARISSGSIDVNSRNPLDEVTGVWAVPTEQGWVPVEQLGGTISAQQAWTGSTADVNRPNYQAPSAPQQAPQQARNAAAPWQPQSGVQPSTRPAAQPSTATSVLPQGGPATPSVAAPPSRPAAGPPTQAGVYPTAGSPTSAAPYTPSVNITVQTPPTAPQPWDMPPNDPSYPFTQGDSPRYAPPPGVLPQRQPSAMNNQQYPYSPGYTPPAFAPASDPSRFYQSAPYGTNPLGPQGSIEPQGPSRFYQSAPYGTNPLGPQGSIGNAPSPRAWDSQPMNPDYPYSPQYTYQPGVVGPQLSR